MGAFLAGILVRHRLHDETARVFQIVTPGLFAPLFFATAGLQADLGGLFAVDTFVVAVVMLAVAVAGKFLGVALGSRFTALDRTEVLGLAIGLNARGAMEIVVAAVGLAAGILSPAIYTVIVVIAIVTS